MCGKINMLYSLLIVHLYLKQREIRLCVMCGKVSFIFHGQRKGVWQFVCFLSNATFVSIASLIVQEPYKFIDSIQCVINWYSK